MTDPVSRETSPSLPEPPAAAAELFGERLRLAHEYAQLLATDGVVRGLIGPREVPRLWDRHLINCGVVAELVPSDAAVCDVGSGAGLPGLVVALLRPDVQMTLLESMARRTDFLAEAVTRLGLANVEVLRGRAEGCAGTIVVDVVLARAVAPLDRLAGWALPLLKPGGRLLALKGESAEEELASAAPVLRRLGGRDPEIRRVGTELIDPPTTVVCITASSRGGRSPGERTPDRPPRRRRR